MNAIKILFSTILIVCLVSCSGSQELLKNNNPDRYTVAKDVLWASPEGFDLTMDIYTPKTGKDNYPVVVIFHGGGWMINDKSIMDQMAKYMATNSEYVICNVNYRLLVDNDNTVTINQIVEDAFGAVLWVKDNIGQYQGDKTQVAVTGDSAGGHLSAMIVNMGHRLSSQKYSEQSVAFKPSYLPVGRTAEQVAEQNGLDVQAAILSYGAYELYQASLQGFEKITNPLWLATASMPRGLLGDNFNAVDNPSVYKGISPLYNIPLSSERSLPPQLLTVGSEDFLMTPASVKNYLQKLESAGHAVQYWEYEGRGHAFLDSGSSMLSGQSFEEDAPEALELMITFLDSVFYSDLTAEVDRAGM